MRKMKVRNMKKGKVPVKICNESTDTTHEARRTTVPDCLSLLSSQDGRRLLDFCPSHDILRVTNLLPLRKFIMRW